MKMEEKKKERGENGLVLLFFKGCRFFKFIE